MARDEAPPFPRGETWYGGGTIDSNDLGGVNFEGREYLFEANSDARGTDNTGRRVLVKVVRNVSGVNLKPARLAHFKAATGVPLETQVDGYTFATADRPAGVVDEYLPAAGVPNNDLFYIVLDGPTKVTQLSASAASIVVGDILVPGAGTSATNDDAGRVTEQSQAGATTVLGSNLQDLVGYADGPQAATVNVQFAAVVHVKK